MAAPAGVVYAQSYLYIDPSIAFGTDRSLEMLLVAMIGGVGTLWGPVLGAVALHAIDDSARTLLNTPGFASMVYGIVLLLIVAVMPNGIASLRLGFRRG
jgi:branched-chain amino acid transport system permease protein